MTLPILIEKHSDEIKKNLSEVEHILVKKALWKYTGRDNVHWKHNDSGLRAGFTCIRYAKKLENFFNDYLPLDKTIPKTDERNISKAIQIFYEKSEIRALAGKYENDISESAAKFIKDLKEMFQLNLAEMKRSPEDAAKNEQNQRKIFNHHSDLSDYTNFAHESKETQFNRDVSYFDERIKNMRSWEKAIYDMKNEAKEYIEKIQEETDEILMKDLKAEEETLRSISAEYESGLVDLENLRQKHISEERDLRIKRYKTEQQLVTVLKLYDRDLIDKQSIFDSKKISLEEEKALLQNFQTKYDEQTEVYNALMAEKEQYEDKMRQGKLYELRCKMAARKIQRCFKRYNAVAGLKKKAEKKTKKVKKPKQVQK